jgi:hypothetical protein
MILGTCRSVATRRPRGTANGSDRPQTNHGERQCIVLEISQPWAPRRDSVSVASPGCWLFSVSHKPRLRVEAMRTYEIVRPAPAGGGD